MFKGWAIPNGKSQQVEIPTRQMVLAEFNREFASYFDKKPPTDEELAKQKAKIIQKIGSFDFEKVVRKYEKLLTKWLFLIIVNLYICLFVKFF